LLRQLFEGAGLRHGVAALLCRRGLGSIYEWRLGVLSRLRLWMGFRVPVGLDTISLWFMGLSAYRWMGMAAWRFLGRMERAADHPPTVELRFAAAPVYHQPPNHIGEPRSRAYATREIVQPVGNLQELRRARNPSWRHQESEPSVGHGSAGGICDRKS